MRKEHHTPEDILSPEWHQLHDIDNGPLEQNNLYTPTAPR